MKDLAINSRKLPERLQKALPRINTTLSHSKRKNTRKAYHSDVATYEAFCQNNGITTPYPVTPETLLIYMDNLAHEPQVYQNRGTVKQTFFKYSTIKRKFFALRAEHVERGLEFCGDHPTMREFLKAIGAEMLEKKATNRIIETQKTAACRSELRAMLDYIDGQLSEQRRFVNRAKLIRDRALLLIGMAGAFRRVELAGLALERVRFVDEGLEIELHEAKNKTSVEEKLHKRIAVNTDRRYCPKRALVEWLNYAGIAGGAIFRSITKGGKVKTEPIDGKAVNLMVKAYAAKAGLAGDFGAHSLRSGFVTQAKKDGHSLDDIRRQGWKSIKTIDERYNQGDGWTNNPSVNLT